MPPNVCDDNNLSVYVQVDDKQYLRIRARGNGVQDGETGVSLYGSGMSAGKWIDGAKKSPVDRGKYTK